MKCELMVTENQDVEETFHWLRSIGIYLDTPDDIIDFVPVIYLELIEIPTVLEILGQSGELIVKKITSHGILFYISQFSIEDPELKRRVLGDFADKVIFCPMSNVKAIWV